MKNFVNRIEEYMDKVAIRKKLILIYIFCVMVPLLITDSVVISVVRNSENKRQEHEMENVANAVHYSFFSEIDRAADLAKSIYTSKYIDHFINRKFESNLNYFNEYNSFFGDSLLDTVIGQNKMQVTFYVDNDTIVNGSEFQKLEKAENTNWYSYMQENELDKGLIIGFEKEREIVYFRRLNFYDKDCKSVVKIEVDYTNVTTTLKKLNYEHEAYICDNSKILLANGKHDSINREFADIDSIKHTGYKKAVSIHGSDLNIIVVPNNSSFIKYFLIHVPLMILLLIINSLLPAFMVRLINNSFIKRLGLLSNAFDKVTDEHLVPIANPSGEDEITSLMVNYNQMVDRTNALIDQVYVNTIREQEMLVARQNAELLALYSQINPHFLFNALESIRMHSLLKQESETADMIEKLAKLQRQYVEWQKDSVYIEKELEFVEAYLGLQKYRFGDRLSYRIDVEEDCKQLCIPKLSIVTFVENACIHGIESKTTPGWIFVRISADGDLVTMEIEDTGNGMTQEDADALIDRMRNASIENLKQKGRVGMVNACLRLRMITKDTVKFDLDSEEYVGTIVTITIPMEYMKEDSVIC